MKMPNITPGPWSVLTEHHHYGSDQWRNLAIRPDFDGILTNATIAKIPKRGSMSKTVANAIAIAALPDVLEALIALLNEAESGVNTCPLTRQKARAALLKAGCTE